MILADDPKFSIVASVNGVRVFVGSFDDPPTRNSVEFERDRFDFGGSWWECGVGERVQGGAEKSCGVVDEDCCFLFLLCEL